MKIRGRSDYNIRKEHKKGIDWYFHFIGKSIIWWTSKNLPECLGIHGSFPCFDYLFWYLELPVGSATHFFFLYLFFFTFSNIALMLLLTLIARLYVNHWLLNGNLFRNPDSTDGKKTLLFVEKNFTGRTFCVIFTRFC